MILVNVIQPLDKSVTSGDPPTGLPGKGSGDSRKQDTDLYHSGPLSPATLEGGSQAPLPPPRPADPVV